MRDSEVVASIVAGDALGLAAAYDRYAEPLYQYCRTLLADSANAADAVQDTFVIAASRLDGLRDPDGLRPWLYAVARNEALRILRSNKGTSALDEAPDMSDDSGDIAADAARVDLRALLEDAAAGLNPGERELIELQLRQGLETAEVATVLGVSRNHAHALLSRATQQLETSLAALLVGRTGRGECGELRAMLDGWDGRLTILLRKRVHRHIEHCATCTARRDHELRPAMLLDLSPGAALAAGAAISLRLARGAPEGLRAHTITLATGQGAGVVAHRAAVLSRAGAFTGSGFPHPAHGAKAAHGGSGGVGSGGSGGSGRAGRVKGALRSSPKGAATVAAVIVIAVIIAAVAIALTGGTQTLKPAAGPSPPRVGAAATPAAASTSASASAGQSAARKTRLKATSAAASARPTASATASPTAETTAALAVAPTLTTARPPLGAPSATPTTARPTPPATRPAPTPTPGALSVDPRGGTLALEPNGPGRQIDLSGSGAGDWHVTWSVAVANDPENAVSVSPASGTLTPGDSTAAVTVTARHFVPCGWPQSPTITVSPGGAVFSVCTGRSRHFTGDGSARADDDAGHASPPGREPEKHRAGTSAQPNVGSHHGRVL
jgi:RNA polymerase sigma factor (sigma-70 family)